MVGNKTVDTNQCNPETLLYSSDECNKHPCGEGKLAIKIHLIYDQILSPPNPKLEYYIYLAFVKTKVLTIELLNF